MTRDELWDALDDLAASDAPATPRTDRLVGPATRLRRRRAAGRALLSVGAASAATAVVLVASSSLTGGGSAGGPALSPALSPAGESRAVPSPATSPSRTHPPAGTVPVRIDAGGGAVGGYAADRSFTGGRVVDFPDRPVTTDGVRSPAPRRVYQSCRYGSRLTYRVGGLVAGGRYLVRLHWAELDFEGAGQRVFAVAVNGRTVLPHVDVVALTGARWRAMVREVRATAADDGAVMVVLTRAGPDNPFLSALEVLPAS